MLITIYHFEQLPLNIRADFDLPAWPYTENKDHFQLFKQYMRELSVFYYSDSDNIVAGRDVSYPLFVSKVEGELLVPPEMAYMSSVYVDRNFRPIKWPADKADGRVLLTAIKNNDVTKDMLAWTNWNVPVTDIAFTPYSIRREIMTERLDPTLCCKGKCTMADKR